MHCKLNRIINFRRRYNSFRLLLTVFCRIAGFWSHITGNLFNPAFFTGDAGRLSEFPELRGREVEMTGKDERLGTADIVLRDRVKLFITSTGKALKWDKVNLFIHSWGSVWILQIQLHLFGTPDPIEPILDIKYEMIDPNKIDSDPNPWQQ